MLEEKVLTCWWRIDDTLMTKSWWQVDDNLMTSWWQVDDVLMTNWWRVDNKLMTSWWRVMTSRWGVEDQWWRVDNNFMTWSALLIQQNWPICCLNSSSNVIKCYQNGHQRFHMGIICRYPSLSVIIRHCPSLSVFIRQYPSDGFWRGRLWGGGPSIILIINLKT